jgi:hypothetical protein
VRADIAPELVEAVAFRRRPCAGEFEDPHNNLQRDMGDIDIGGIGLCRRLASTTCRRIVPVIKGILDRGGRDIRKGC